MNTAAVIIAALLADNFLFSRFFGIESFFSVSEKKSSVLIYGGLVTLVTVTAGFLAVMLNKMVFSALNIEYMSTFATALLTISVICAYHLLSKKISESAYLSYTKNMPVVSTNCVVIAAARLCTENSLSLGMSIVYLVAAGAGFTLSLMIFSAIRERIEYSSSPVAAFKGLPILLLAASFAAMAFSGFVGIGG